MKTRHALGALLFAAALMYCAAALRADNDHVWKAPARAKKKTNPIAADSASIKAGKAVYVKECQDCHGALGKGDGAAAKDLRESPTDLSSGDQWDQTDGEVFWKITNGSKPMPAYDTLLKEEERWHVVNYVRTLAPRKTKNGEAK